MKTLIVYDSVYNNTEKIAEAIGKEFPRETIKVIKADQAKQSDLDGVKIFIAGSPTQGGRAVPPLLKFLNEIPDHGLKDVKVTAFDTRMTGEDHGFGIKLLVKVIGYAAGRIAATLKNKGGTLIVPPEGFVVGGREGPLKDGEIERATAWGKQILTAVK